MIELRVLGPTSLKRSNGSTVASLLAQPKRLALAVYLAAPPPHGGRCFHRKDTLIGMFWPELDQQHARAALRNALYFLRTHLGPEAVRTGEHDSVGLDPDAVWCDLDAFDVAVRMRDHATAYQLYRGALLEGVFVHDAQPFEEWLDEQRQRRSGEARAAASQAARRHAAAGRLDEALVWARRSLAMSPTNEDAARLLIALRHLTGDRGGALEEYQRLATLLENEYGVEPSRETQRLVQAVRDPEADPVAVANAIAQLPVQAATLIARSRDTNHARARVHDRDVLDALVQTRVGLARRRGARVGVVLVRLADNTPARRTDGNGDDPQNALDLVAQSILAGIRGADLATYADQCTLALLPSEDGAMDMNAFVGRLDRHIDRARQLAGEEFPPYTIETVWIDPTSGRSTRELLAEALHTG